MLCFLILNWGGWLARTEQLTDCGLTWEIPFKVQISGCVCKTTDWKFVAIIARNAKFKGH